MREHSAKLPNVWVIEGLLLYTKYMYRRDQAWGSNMSETGLRVRMGLAAIRYLSSLPVSLKATS